MVNFVKLALPTKHGLYAVTEDFATTNCLYVRSNKIWSEVARWKKKLSLYQMSLRAKICRQGLDIKP